MSFSNLPKTSNTSKTIYHFILKKVIIINVVDIGKSLEETKKDLEELNEFGVVFDELDSPFEAQASMYMDNNAFMRNQLLISEIKDKQEITDRLNSLSYSVGWLKAAIIIKDNNIAAKAIKNIMKNEYSSINSIVSELNSLKNKIDKLEILHTSLLKSGSSLDVKTLLEQDFREKRKKLNGVHNKQKNILLSLSNIFVKLTKHSVLKNKNK